MKGTEKQIKWANDIKEKSILAAIEFKDRTPKEEGKLVIQKYIDDLTSKEDSSYFIDNKDSQTLGGLMLNFPKFYKKYI